jgi:hypothetical protein
MRAVDRSPLALATVRLDCSVPPAFNRLSTQRRAISRTCAGSAASGFPMSGARDARGRPLQRAVRGYSAAGRAVLLTDAVERRIASPSAATLDHEVLFFYLRRYRITQPGYLEEQPVDPLILYVPARARPRQRAEVLLLTLIRLVDLER